MITSIVPELDWLPYPTRSIMNKGATMMAPINNSKIVCSKVHDA